MPPPGDVPRGPFARPPASATRGDADARWFEPDYDWRKRAGSDLTTCVVVRTYIAQRNMLVALLGSMAASRHPGLYVVVVDTGKQEPMTELQAIADQFNAIVERPYAVSVSRWNYHNSRALYPELEREDYGYVATDLALEDALYGAWPMGADGKAVMRCDTFLVTNGDNLYTEDFFRTTLSAVDSGFDMVGTHWISHYGWDNPIWDQRTPDQLKVTGGCGSMRSGKDMEMWTAGDFHISCIDLGAVVFRRWIMETAGIRFVVDNLSANATGGGFDFFTADGWFYQRTHALPGVKDLVVRESLMIHQ